MPVILQSTIYLFIGFIEMFLATARTSFIARGRTFSASAIVFVENVLYFIILYQFINNLNENWLVFIFYSLGGALKTFANLRKTS